MKIYFINRGSQTNKTKQTKIKQETSYQQSGNQERNGVRYFIGLKKIVVTQNFISRDTDSQNSWRNTKDNKSELDDEFVLQETFKWKYLKHKCK